MAQLISERISAAKFSASVAEELETHLGRLATKGASAPVALTEYIDLPLDQPGLAVLLSLFAAGQLTSPELSYIDDALQLADRVQFSDSVVADAVAECTDPAINGQFTVGRALELLGSRHAV